VLPSIHPSFKMRALHPSSSCSPRDDAGVKRRCVYVSSPPPLGSCDRLSEAFGAFSDLSHRKDGPKAHGGVPPSLRCSDLRLLKIRSEKQPAGLRASARGTLRGPHSARHLREPGDKMRIKHPATPFFSH